MADEVASAPVIERNTTGQEKVEDRSRAAAEEATGKASEEAAKEQMKLAGKGGGTPEMDTSRASVEEKLGKLAESLKKGGGAATEIIKGMKDLNNAGGSKTGEEVKDGKKVDNKLKEDGREPKGTGGERQADKTERDAKGMYGESNKSETDGDAQATRGTGGGGRGGKTPEGRGHSVPHGLDAQRQGTAEHLKSDPDIQATRGTGGGGFLGKGGSAGRSPNNGDAAQQVGTDVVPRGQGDRETVPEPVRGQGELGKKLTPGAMNAQELQKQEELTLQEARGFRWPGGVNWNNLLGGDKDKKSDASPKDPRGAVSDFGQQMQKQMQDRVGQRLENGDFVPPSDSKTTEQRAGDLVNGIVNGELNGGFKDRMPMVGGAGMGDDKFYRDKIGEKTGDIDKKEQEIAKDMWDKLDQGTRDKIKSEMESGHLMLLGGDQSSRTPNLDKFKADVAKAIQGPEAERKQAEKDVYNSLPDNAKRQLLESDEMNKRMGKSDEGIILKPQYDTPFVNVDSKILDKYLSDKNNPDSWSRDEKNQIKEAGKLKAERDAEGNLKKVTIGDMTFEKDGDTVTIKGAEKNAKGSTERYFDGVTDFKIVESKDPKNGSVTFDVRIKQTLPNKMTEGSIGSHKIQHENLKGLQKKK